MREMKWIGLNKDISHYVGMWMNKNAAKPSFVDNPDAKDIQDNS